MNSSTTAAFSDLLPVEASLLFAPGLSLSLLPVSSVLPVFTVSPVLPVLPPDGCAVSVAGVLLVELSGVVPCEPELST